MEMFSEQFPLLLRERRFSLYAKLFHPFRKCEGPFWTVLAGTFVSSGIGKPRHFPVLSSARALQPQGQRAFRLPAVGTQVPPDRSELGEEGALSSPFPLSSPLTFPPFSSPYFSCPPFHLSHAIAEAASYFVNRLSWPIFILENTFVEG